jgi:hypothetical protein
MAERSLTGRLLREANTRDPDRSYRGAMAADPVGPRHVALVEYGRERPLPQRQDVYNHSPDGFSWGYQGSGPAQLALAILCDAIGPNEAVRWHQDFKRDHIAKLALVDAWTMPASLVWSWWVFRSIRETAAERGAAP